MGAADVLCRCKADQAGRLCRLTLASGCRPDPAATPIACHPAGAYPYTGGVKEVGKGAGEGFTINLPLPGDSGAPAGCAGRRWGAGA